jgi:NAD+ kinase
MQKIGLVYHPLNEKALTEAQHVAELVGAAGLPYWLCSAWEPQDMRANLPGTDLIITAGGDGTILRVAEVAADPGVPLLGINLGKLGFMTELSVAEVDKRLPEVLAGQGWLDERAMLTVEFHRKQGAVQRFQALNDVVLARGEIARIIYIQASVDGEKVVTYKTDGVVVATATGSTGYALAAGGPVLHPQAQDYLLVPIAPHLCLPYPLVIPARSKVRLALATAHQATLSVDGHISLPLCDGDSLSIALSPTKMKFLRLRPQNYFYSQLEHKLRGQP